MEYLLHMSERMVVLTQQARALPDNLVLWYHRVPGLDLEPSLDTPRTAPTLLPDDQRLLNLSCKSLEALHNIEMKQFMSPNCPRAPNQLGRGFRPYVVVFPHAY